MKTGRNSIFLIILLLTSSSILLSQRRCGTMAFDSINRIEQHLPPFSEYEEQAETDVNLHSRSSRIYRIPVIVHVIHSGEPTGEGPNISSEQVRSQIQVLNEDFRKIEGSRGYSNTGVDTRIEFYPVDRSPDGTVLSEPGIDRVKGERNIWPSGPVRNPIERELKPRTIWDPEKYFNIWTVNFGGFTARNLLGYAQFPDMSGLPGISVANGEATTDGVVIGYRYFGTRDAANFPDLYSPFDLGRTTTHEVGHWLGLRHIWGDGDCYADDYCNDTPTASEPNYGCPSTSFSCRSEDMFRNYMDYTDDVCMNIFTNCQKERMITVLENSPRRKELIDITSTSVRNGNNEEINIFVSDKILYLNKNLPLKTGSFLRIYSIDGRQVYSKSQLPVSNLQLDLNFLPDGFYFLLLINSDSRSLLTRKVILY